MGEHFSKFLDNRRRVVFRSGGRPGVYQNDIGRRLNPFPERLLNRVIFVGHNFAQYRDPSALLDHSRKNGPIELDDLTRQCFSRPAGRNDFAAGGLNKYLRSGKNAYRQGACRQEGTNIGRPQNMLPWQEQLTRHDVFTHLAHVLPRECSRTDFNLRMRYALDMFDHDDRVRTLWKRVACVDREGALSGKAKGRSVARAECIAGAHRVAVHCRSMIVRDRAYGDNWLRSNTSKT